MNSIQQPQRQSVMDVIMLLMLYGVAFISMDKEYLAITLYGILPIVFAISIIHYNNPFHQNSYMKSLLFMYLWIGLTSVAAIYEDLAIDQMKQILGVIVLCSIFANLSKNAKNIPWLYGIYIVYYISILKFAQENLLGEIIMFEERLGGEDMNANMLAYFTFYTTIAIYVLGEFVKSGNIQIIFRVLFIATIALSFFIAMLTASRQVLILQLPLYIILMYIRYASKSKWQLLTMIAACAITVWIVKDQIIELYNGSLLEERNELSIEDDERTMVLQEAIEYGMDNPIFGLGPGNFVKYSSLKVFTHCTYAELFANSGVIAALIFIILVIRFILVQWKRYQRYGTRPYIIFCLFGIFFAIDNFFYVFYTSLWLMGFFILVATHSEIYHQNNIRALSKE